MNITARLDGIVVKVTLDTDPTPEVTEDYLRRAARTVLRIYAGIPALDAADTADPEG